MAGADRPLILLSNDDGHASRGIRALRLALLDVADVILVAPESEQSAASHALSLHRPLRAREAEPGIFAVDGTPADCVYVALNAGTRFLEKKPSLVVSGINHGLNLGQDVFYSGTVAAAREGALRRIPSLAVSAHPHADFAKVATLATMLAQSMMARNRRTPAPLLNLNVPKTWNGEIRRTRLGERIYEQGVEFRTDPRGREYIWLGGSHVRHERNDGTDTDAYDDGAASITPLCLDLTHMDDDAYAEAIAQDVRGTPEGAHA
ncbi:MAG: 5'/3'-nucleotidase SurE [Polyangiaceae bacterium]